MLMSRLQNKTRIVHEKGMEMRRTARKTICGGTIVFIRELRKNVSAFNGTNSVNLIHEKGYAVNVMRNRATDGQSANVRRQG